MGDVIREEGGGSSGSLFCPPAGFLTGPDDGRRTREKGKGGEKGGEWPANLFSQPFLRFVRHSGERRKKTEGEVEYNG